jgi:hypothetical protein
MSQRGIVFAFEHTSIGPNYGVLLAEELKTIIASGFHARPDRVWHEGYADRALLKPEVTGRFLLGMDYRRESDEVFSVNIFELWTIISAPEEMSELARCLFGRDEDLGYEGSDP